MGLRELTILLLLLAAVLWLGRRMPLAGARRGTALACRLAALGALCAVLWAAPRQRQQVLPRQVVYLVDGSASIDDEQRSWMARRIASLESLRPKGVARAVIVFGGEARLLIPLGREPLTEPALLDRALAQADIRRDGTNLEAALLAALGVLEPHRRGGVVLLSDGAETAGNVSGLLGYARRAGLSVFPAPAPLAVLAATVWDQLIVPPVAQQGAPVPLQLVLFNGTGRATTAQVTVALQGVAVKRQRVIVRPGWQVRTVSVPAIGRGTMALEAHLAIPNEGLSERRSAYTEVEGPPQLLLVAEQPAALPALGSALKRREMSIAVARAADLPTDAAGLLDYDAVLLFNLAKSAISAEQVQALRTYVEGFGGGLVMVGLGGELAREVTTPSPLDALLPVAFEPKGLQEAKRRVCMVLLIDRSGSMLGPRIAATKRAAVEFIKQLSPEDLVGVLAFDTKPYVVAEVQPASQIGSWVVDKLVTLRSSGGTDIYPALAAAANRLELTDATLKHIILLSDGNTPINVQAYEALLEGFRLSGISISTVGVGSVFINTDYLQWLADATGGTFYQMQSLEELPKMVARDTQQALGELPFTEGSFRPARTPTTDWFSEQPDVPPLRGYVTATARAGAAVDLTVNGGGGDDPLLARWSLGQGRVVSFTSDADARWAPEWIRWPGFEGTWAQIVRWVMRRRLLEEVFVRVEEHQGRSLLVLEGELQDPQGTLASGDGTERVPLSFVQVGTWRWHASLEGVRNGWHQLVLESRAQPGAESATLFTKRWVRVGTPPAAQERAGQPPRESLLRQMAQATGGAYDLPDAALVPPTTTAATTVPPSAWWLPLVILLLLAEIAVRGSSML